MLRIVVKVATTALHARCAKLSQGIKGRAPAPPFGMHGVIHACPQLAVASPTVARQSKLYVRQASCTSSCRQGLNAELAHSTGNGHTAVAKSIDRREAINSWVPPGCEGRGGVAQQGEPAAQTAL